MKSSFTCPVCGQLLERTPVYTSEEEWPVQYVYCHDCRCDKGGMGENEREAYEDFCERNQVPNGYLK